MTAQSKKHNGLRLEKVEWTEQVIPVSNSKCNHYFEFVGQECLCKNCGMGLIGVLTLRDGKPL